MQHSDNERVFDDWDDMVEDMHEHILEHGFHLGYWRKAILDELGKRGGSRIGFFCNKTQIVWHMQQDEWNEQNPLGKNFWKDADRKKQYMEALKFRFSLSRDDEPKCKVSGCTHNSNPKKDGFCGWCYNRFEKGMLDVEGNRILSWKERKERIRGKIEMEHLKVLQDAHPEVNDNFVCTKIQITIEEASCFRRMFIDQFPRSACKACHIHDQRFDFLEDFLDAHINKHTT
jgi:hypothetical protein